VLILAPPLVISREEALRLSSTLIAAVRAELA
jgi:hypothetical protein